MPPCPHVSRRPVITSTASAAVRARSRPRRTRSMPISAGLAAAASCVVPTRSFPMATPYSLTPCSAPHSQVGTGEQRGVRARVADREVLGAQRASRRGAAAEGPGDLDLARRAVRILGEHHAAPTRGTERVAHGRSVGTAEGAWIGLPFVEPRAVLTADEIDLSDTEFWARPWDEREGAFQTLRRERPMPFFEEPEIPEALSYVIPKGKGYYALDAPRPHCRGQPAPRDLPVGAGRHLHHRHARGDARLLRLHDQHGQPAPRPPAPDRVRRLQPAHDQVDRGPDRAAWPTT